MTARHRPCDGDFHGLISGGNDWLFIPALMAIINTLYWAVMLLVWVLPPCISRDEKDQTNWWPLPLVIPAEPFSDIQAWVKVARLLSRLPASYSPLDKRAHSEPAGSQLQAGKSCLESSVPLWYLVPVLLHRPNACSQRDGEVCSAWPGLS